MTTINLTFTKMHGIGNDFVMLDARDGLAESLPSDADLAIAMCDRKFGIGADGLIFIEAGSTAPVRMRMLNPDGSESEMCGNGLRCVAKMVSSKGSVAIETGGRSTLAELLPDGRVRIDMGVATVIDTSVRVAGFDGVSISIGNPHFVTFLDDVASIELTAVGPLIEHDQAFPDRTNVHFAQVVDRSTLLQRTWERGAGVTLACGSGACAGAVAAFARGLTGPHLEVHLPGGILELETNETGQVWMTGPAQKVFSGEFRLG